VAVTGSGCVWCRVLSGRGVHFFSSSYPATSVIYSLSLHDALPIFGAAVRADPGGRRARRRGGGRGGAGGDDPVPPARPVQRDRRGPRGGGAAPARGGGRGGAARGSGPGAAAAAAAATGAGTGAARCGCHRGADPWRSLSGACTGVLSTSLRDVVPWLDEGEGLGRAVVALVR